MSTYRINMIDHSNENTSVTLPIRQITSLNHDDVVGIEVPALKVAIGAVTLCNFTTDLIGHSKDYSVPVVPTNKNAQREIGLEVKWVDGTAPQTKGSFTIPAPDLTLFAESGTDLVDMDEVAPAALKAALEANCESPAGNAIVVTQMRIVGRRN